MRKKGNIALAWMSALVAVVVVAFGYIIFSEPMSILVDFANGTISRLSDNGIRAGFARTVNVIQTAWHWWPVLFIIAAFIYVVVWAIRREVSNQYTY